MTSRELQGKLACPRCRTPLESLACRACQRSFPVVDGIPLLLPVEQVVAGLGQVNRDPGAGRLLPGGAPGVQAACLTWSQGYHLRVVQGSNPLQLRSSSDFLFASLTGHLPSVKELVGLMSCQGALGMSRQPGNSMLGMLDVRRVLVKRGDRVVEEAMSGGFGPGWVPTEVRVEGYRESLEDLAANRVDPRRVLLVEEPLPQPQPADLRGQVRLVHFAEDRLEYETTLSAAGWVVLSELHYPGWRAFCEGKEVPLVRAYGILRAVWLPAGTHRFKVAYLPWWRWTFGVSLGVLLLTLGALVVRKSR